MRPTRIVRIAAVVCGAAALVLVTATAVRVRSRADDREQLRVLCAAEVERVNHSPAFVVLCDRSALYRRLAPTHVKFQRRVASYAIQFDASHDPPLGILRFEIAKARTTVEGSRHYEEARADNDFQVAFPEIHLHTYERRHGEWVLAQQRQNDTFVDWLAGKTVWFDCKDPRHGLPDGMIRERDPDPLSGW